MRIRDVVIWAEEIPFKFSFKHALAERRHSSSIIVKATLDNGVCGWGEGVPRAYVTGETVESCLVALRTRIVPRLSGVDVTTAATLRSAILALHDEAETARDLAALCAVELALLDALARSQKKTMYELVGRERRARTVVYSMVIGSSQRQARKLALLSRLVGINEIKVKVGSSVEEDQQRVLAVKRAHPRARLRVDANCAWTLEQAKRSLDVLRPLGVIACEQPLAKSDIGGHARLVAEYPDILICADESLCSFADARVLVAERAFSCFNIRLSKNGGLFNALRIHGLAREAGIACQLGAQVGETSILSMAGRLFAGMTGNLRFHEGSFGTRLIKSDVIRRSMAFGLGGRASTRCRGWGWGVPADESRVARYSTERVLLPEASPAGDYRPEPWLGASPALAFGNSR
jgi:muconate cycloisomerase